MSRQSWYMPVVQGLSSATTFALIFVACGAPFYWLLLWSKEASGVVKLLAITATTGAFLPWLFWVLAGIMGLINDYKPKEFAIRHLRALPIWIGVGLGIAFAFLALVAVTRL